MTENKRVNVQKKNKYFQKLELNRKLLFPEVEPLKQILGIPGIENEIKS